MKIMIFLVARLGEFLQYLLVKIMRVDVIRATVDGHILTQQDAQFRLGSFCSVDFFASAAAFAPSTDTLPSESLR